MSPNDFIPVDPTATPEPSPLRRPTPTADVDPDAPVYPDLDSLLDIGGGRAGVFWPAAGAAGPDTVATLGGLTVEGQTSLTVIPSTTTAQGADRCHGRGSWRRPKAREVLVYDTDVSTALQQASLVDEAALRGGALTEATAYLAFAAADAARAAPLLVALDRDTARSRVGLRSAITTATEAPGVEPVTLGRLASADTIDIQIADADIDPTRVAAASALFSEETELVSLRDDPRRLEPVHRTRARQHPAAARLWHGSPILSRGLPRSTAHRAATTVTLNSVDLLPTSTVNLFGSGADLGFWVRNDLPYPVNLILYATPDSLRLDVQRATPVVAGASSNTRVEVPVQARVGNGEVTLALQLRSRASVAIGDGAFVEVNVRAEWEGVGVVALSVVVGGLLVLGIGRTVLRVRSRRRAAAAVAAGAASSETADAAGTSGEPGETGDPDPAVPATDQEAPRKPPMTTAPRTARERHRARERAHRRRHDRLAAQRFPARGRAGHRGELLNQADRRRGLLRRVAQPRVGTTLAGHDEAERTRCAFDRDADLHRVAVGLDGLLEGLVELGLAGGDRRGADGVRRELELVAIEVVARRDVEGHLDRPRVERPGRELESLVGLEKIVGGEGGLPERMADEGEQQQYGAGARRADRWPRPAAGAGRTVRERACMTAWSTPVPELTQPC